MNDTPTPPAAARTADAAGAPAPPPASTIIGAVREITLQGLLATLVRGLWILFVVTLLAVAVVAVILKLSPPDYTARMIIAPAGQDFAALGRLTADLEQYASLATLGQTPTKLDRTSPLERYVQVLHSPELAERLQAENGLLQIIWKDSWDAATNTWQPPDDLLQPIKQKVLEFFRFPGWVEPDATALASYLAGRLRVQRMGGSSLYRLRFEHPERDFATDLVTMVHAAADNLLRETELARIDARITQIERELATTSDATRQQALEEVLRSDYQVQALLKADQPFAAEVLVPADAGPAPSSPSPFLVLALAAAIGLILGIFVVFVRDVFR